MKLRTRPGAISSRNFAAMASLHITRPAWLAAIGASP
jgi:hypothetical protein